MILLNNCVGNSILRPALYTNQSAPAAGCFSPVPRWSAPRTACAAHRAHPVRRVPIAVAVLRNPQRLLRDRLLCQQLGKLFLIAGDGIKAVIHLSKRVTHGFRSYTAPDSAGTGRYLPEHSAPDGSAAAQEYCRPRSRAGGVIQQSRQRAILHRSRGREVDRRQQAGARCRQRRVRRNQLTFSPTISGRRFSSVDGSWEGSFSGVRASKLSPRATSPGLLPSSRLSAFSCCAIWC